MTTKILVNHGERQELVKLFKCSYPTVRTALNGKVKTPLAYKIRKAAIERGGIEIEPVKKERV